MAIFGKSYEHYLGYALSGGGAKGFAHLGALKVLEQYGLKPDIIAGTSAGSLAGVLYADGYSPDEIGELFKKTEFRQFAEFAIPRSGFFHFKGLHHFLKSNLRAKSFEELKTPLVVVVTDWNRARTVTFSSGPNLVESVVASCSVPVAISPQYIEDVPYVDGGLLKNFPVSVIREQCKYVVGINVSLIRPPLEKNNIRRVVERTFNVMANSNTLLDRRLCDILIEVEGIHNYPMFDLHNMDAISEIGYMCAADKMAEESSFPIIRRCLRHNRLSEKVLPQIKRFKQLPVIGS